jgi:hypothetical protein
MSVKSKDDVLEQYDQDFLVTLYDGIEGTTTLENLQYLLSNSIDKEYDITIRIGEKDLVRNTRIVRWAKNG